jgi:hypothetical protein
MKECKMQLGKPYPQDWHIVDEVAFIAIFVGALIMIMAVGVTLEAVQAAVYLASLTGAWRAGVVTRRRLRNRRS